MLTMITLNFQGGSEKFIGNDGQYYIQSILISKKKRICFTTLILHMLDTEEEINGDQCYDGDAGDVGVGEDGLRRHGHSRG